MTDHTIKAHMEVIAEGGVKRSRAPVSRSQLIQMIAEKSREVDQIVCADEHVRYAHRIMGTLDVINEQRALMSGGLRGAVRPPIDENDVERAVSEQQAADLEAKREAFKKEAGEATWPGKDSAALQNIQPPIPPVPTPPAEQPENEPSRDIGDLPTDPKG